MGLLDEVCQSVLEEDLDAHVYDTLEKAVATYNNERLHMSIDWKVPSVAHEFDHSLPKRWRNYYTSVNPVQDKPELVTLTQDQRN